MECSISLIIGAFWGCPCPICETHEVACCLVCHLWLIWFLCKYPRIITALHTGSTYWTSFVVNIPTKMKIVIQYHFTMLTMLCLMTQIVELFPTNTLPFLQPFQYQAKWQIYDSFVKLYSLVFPWSYKTRFLFLKLQHYTYSWLLGNLVNFQFKYTQWFLWKCHYFIFNDGNNP